MRRTPLLAALALLAACATDLPITAPLQRTDAAPASVVSTTFIGTGFVFPEAINDHDVVTGSFRAGGTDHAFRWIPGGAIQDLHGAAPWVISRANDISNAGHIVGHAYELLTSTWPRPWIWTPAVPSLTTLSSSLGAATGVNNHGLAVGYVVGADGNTRFATAWPSTGGETRSTVPGSVALDVSDAGQVLVSVSFAFAIWNPVSDPSGTAMQIIKAANFPGAGWSYFQPTRIDELGRVTGVGGRGSVNSAFLWTPGPGAGTVQQLATTGFSGWAMGINGSNQATGFRMNTATGQTLPVYWPSLGGEAALLPDPIGSTNGRAASINASGKIVGWVSNATSGRGVLWDLNALAVNIPPIANAGPDQVVACVNAMANVTLDGRASSDPDGQIVNYSWRWLALNLDAANGPTPTLPLGQGVFEFDLTVTDDGGATAVDRVRAEVRDMAQPEIQATQHVTELWPPDRRMVKVVSGIKASDVCTGSAPVTVTITSNDAIEGDYQIVSTLDGYEVHVRATRDARNADGRTYTITMSAHDGTHQATRAATVTVPRMPR